MPEVRVTNAVLLCVVPLAAVFTPVLAAGLLCFFFAARARSVALGSVLTGLFVTGFLGWMNADKRIVEDWVWYTDHYKLLQQLPLSQYLGQFVYPVRVKASEPVYYTGSYLLARASHGNVPVLAFAVSAAVYLPLTAALVTILRTSSLRSVERNFVVLLGLLGGVTFTLTTQLVRQEIASAFLILGVVRYAYSRRISGLIFIGLALLTHNSSLIPLLAFVASGKYVAPRGRIVKLRLIIAGASFALASFAITHAFANLAYDAASKNDGSVSLFVFAADAIIFAAFVHLRGSMLWLGRLHGWIAAAFILHVTFTLGVINQPVPFLRFYFYVEVFRTVMLAAVLVTLIRRNSLAVVAVPALFLIVAYFELRVARSPYNYQGGLLQHLLDPIMLRS